MSRLASGTIFLLFAAGPAAAQGLAGSSAANPFVESSAGRAWQRIAFGALDCGPGLSEAADFCPADAFSQSGLFVNGTYQDIRFVYAGAAPGGPNTADFLANRVITQSQTFPQASTASGFSFSWNGPTPTLDSQMFGPLFGDRGRTNGRGKLSATLTVQNLRWEKLDGSQIRNDQAGLLWGDDNYADFGNGPAGYVGRCRMDIDSLVTSLALTYGVTDRLDLTVSAPLVRTTVEGSNEFLDYVVLPDGRITIDPEVTFFTPQGRFFVKGTSTGLGDMTAGFTWAVVKNETTALGVVGRVNIGTGSFEEMTGTGETQVSGGIVGSYESGPVAPHFSVAYFGANQVLFDEARGVIGLDVRAVPNRLTLSVELLARRLMDVQGFTATRTLGSVTSPVTGDAFEVQDFAAVRGDYSLYFLNVGGKLRIAGQLLGTAYMLIPWGDQGLVAQKPSWNFGLNYAFGPPRGTGRRPAMVRRRFHVPLRDRFSGRERA
jgi:hypothetical protein